MHPVVGAFYDEVMRELIAAVGAALFFGNLFALLRRRGDADRAAAKRVAQARPGSPVRGQAKAAATGELAQVPIARTVTYLVIGFVVMIAGLASLTA
jgi:hypothetical protein